MYFLQIRSEQKTTQRAHSHTGETSSYKCPVTDYPSKRHSTPLMPKRDTPSPPPGYIPPDSEHEHPSRLGMQFGEGHFIPEPEEIPRSDVSIPTSLYSQEILCHYDVLPCVLRMCMQNMYA